MTTTRDTLRIRATGAGAALVLLSGCAGFGGQSGGGATTLTIASVNNPQMQDMASLAEEFEREHPDIRLNFLLMEENDLRDSTTKDMAADGGQFDVMTVGSYEVPIFAENEWLVDLGARADGDAEYDVDDLFAPVREQVTYDDKLYGVPFYGESSFLMYRTDLVEEAGLTMPEHPTWDEVAEIARALHSPEDGRAGICLRGKPGWGEMFAPLTTVVNTFGGQWYDMDWQAQVDAENFTRASRFYTDLIREAGPADPVSFGFTECLNLFQQGGAALWYDATSAAGTLSGSDLGADIGYVHAPVDQTDESGWLWSWNLVIPQSSERQDAAWEFVRWATSKEYIQLVGTQIGWNNLPPGSRASTYEIPEYVEAAQAYADITADIMRSVDPAQPGVDPQPWVGIQYVTIPEFQDIGNQVSQRLADVLAGRADLEDALAAGNRVAQIAGDKQGRAS